jgi:hypothetical protein
VYGFHVGMLYKADCVLCGFDSEKLCVADCDVAYMDQSLRSYVKLTMM